MTWTFATGAGSIMAGAMVSRQLRLIEGSAVNFNGYWGWLIAGVEKCVGVEGGENLPLPLPTPGRLASQHL
jgi:hypothetical protein